jgi:hypothetical protein
MADSADCPPRWPRLVAGRCGIRRCSGAVARCAGSRQTSATDHRVRYETSDGSADGLLMPATVHADTSDKRMRSESCSTTVPAT